MAEGEATVAVGERQHPDKSPEAVEEAKIRKVRPAEVSNLDIVRHYFDIAADHLGLADDLRVVFWTPYREVTVQIPVTSTPAIASSTTAPAVPTRAASASTPTWTSTRSARLPP
jgi:hypothetical protein